MKGIGLILIILAGAGVGWYSSMKLSRRAAILQSFERLAAYTATGIRYTASPMAELFAAAGREAEFTSIKPFLDRFSLRQDWRESFREGLRHDFTGQGLEETDIALMSAWGEGLGSTDVAGQLAHCERFESRLGEQAKGARQQALVKGKLYTSLGVAGGLVITLLWI